MNKDFTPMQISKICIALLLGGTVVYYLHIIALNTQCLSSH